MKVNDLVEWESHAGASSTSKQGRVVLVVPQGTKPDRYFAQLSDTYNVTKVKRTLTESTGMRPHESYLVAVEMPAGQRPVIYWPRVVLLRKIGEQTELVGGAPREVEEEHGRCGSDGAGSPGL